MFYLMLVASSYYFSPSNLLFHQFCTAIIFLLSSVYDSKDSVSISSVRFFGSVFFCPPLGKGGEKAASPTHTVNTTERRHAASGRVHPWPMKRKRERERERERRPEFLRLGCTVEAMGYCIVLGLTREPKLKWA